MAHRIATLVLACFLVVTAFADDSPRSPLQHGRNSNKTEKASKKPPRAIRKAGYPRLPAPVPVDDAKKRKFSDKVKVLFHRYVRFTATADKREVTAIVYFLMPTTDKIPPRVIGAGFEIAGLPKGTRPTPTKMVKHIRGGQYNIQFDGMLANVIVAGPDPPKKPE